MPSSYDGFRHWTRLFLLGGCTCVPASPGEDLLMGPWGSSHLLPCPASESLLDSTLGWQRFHAGACALWDHLSAIPGLPPQAGWHEFIRLLGVWILQYAVSNALNAVIKMCGLFPFCYGSWHFLAVFCLLPSLEPPLPVGIQSSHCKYDIQQLLSS